MPFIFGLFLVAPSLFVNIKKQSIMAQAFNTGGGRPTTLLYHHSVINLPRLQDSRSYEDEEIWSCT